MSDFEIYYDTLMDFMFLMPVYHAWATGDFDSLLGCLAIILWVDFVREVLYE